MSSTTDTRKSGELNIYQKIAAITGEIGAIQKAGRNKDQGYQFIEYAAVAGELRKLFAKYNVVIVPRMERSKHQERETLRSAKGSVGYHILIDFHFTVINGDNPDDKFTVPWTGEATEWGDKGTNKAATSALKYYLMRQFNISEKGDDPDGVSPEQLDVQPQGTPEVTVDAPKASPTKPVTAKQSDMIYNLASELGLNDEEIKERMAKINNAAQASAAITKLKADLGKS